jgi:hypothetical protein
MSHAWEFKPLLPFDNCIDLAVVDIDQVTRLADQADWLFSIWSRWGSDGTRTRGRVPAWVSSHPNALVFEYDDTCDRMGPSESDVMRLLDAAPLLRGRVLIHCRAGFSRSAATALTLLAARLGPKQEEAAVQALKLVCARTEERGWRSGGMSPNLRMVRFADEFLGYGGGLVRLMSDIAWHPIGEAEDDDPHFG